MARIAIIGAGAFGTSLGIYANSLGHSVRVWCFEQDLPDIVRDQGENAVYLPGYPIDPAMVFSNRIPSVLEEAELVLLVCPSSHMRSVCEALSDHVPSEAVLASATKGIENETLYMMSQVQEETLPAHRERLACLSGPSFAKDVAAGLPTNLTCTGDQSRNRTLGERVGGGEAVEQVTNSQKAVAEGYVTVRAVRALKERLGVDMPIVEAVYQVCYEGSDFREEAEKLANRDRKEEFQGILTQ